MNMPLTIGIENGTDKGFTKEELQLTNGFALGAICMHAGVGRIGNEAYRTVISAEEAHERIKLVLDTMPLWDDQENTFAYKWLTNLDNIKRLEENHWYCNAGNKTTAEFVHHMRKVIFDNATRDTMFKYSPSISYDDLRNRHNTVRSIVGTILSGDAKEYYGNDINWVVESLNEAFEPYDYHDLSKPFYDNKYLVYNEHLCEYRLSNKPQQEE